MTLRTCLAASVFLALSSTLPAFGDWSGVIVQTETQVQAADLQLQPEAPAATQEEAAGGSFENEMGVQALDLDENRGREGTTTLNQVNKMTLDAVMTNNVTENVVSGNNVITDGSFAGTNGFPMVIQNTGSNVIIQNATILNLNVK